MSVFLGEGNSRSRSSGQVGITSSAVSQPRRAVALCAGTHEVRPGRPGGDCRGCEQRILGQGASLDGRREQDVAEHFLAGG
jgi:hypothetical protein